MNDKPSGESKGKPVGADLIIPVTSIAFCAYYFSTITEVPWTAQVSAVLVGSVLILLSTFFVIKTLRDVLRGRATLGFSRLIEPVSYVRKRSALLALTLGYIFAIHLLGFTLTTFVFLAAAMMLLSNGRRKGFIVILSAILAVGGYLLFVIAFETRFPEGALEHFLKEMF
jgi:hypothetical protein